MEQHHLKHQTRATTNHTVIFQDEEADDLPGQYFIAVEQQLVLESSNIVAAIFHLLCAHYIFNVQYYPKGRGTPDIPAREGDAFC